VAQAKQIERALRAFRALLADVPEARYLIVGDWAGAGVNLPDVVAELGLEQVVQYTGHVPELPEFLEWIASVDVVVNLRYPTVGETSATALRALAGGRPLLVYDHGWYSELPDEVCLKTPPLDDAALLTAMQRLARDEHLRLEMGHQASIYAVEVHAPARAAEAYMAFIERVLVGLRPSFMAANA